MSPVQVLPDDALEVIIRGAIGAAFGEFVLVDNLPAPADRLARLEQLDEVLARSRAAVADARARVIADAVAGSTSRAVAAELGMSVAAVGKAAARARTIEAPAAP